MTYQDDCTFLVRMLRDFGSDTLPVDALHTYDASHVPRLATSTWPRINAAAADLVFECLKGSVPTAGWVTIEKNIALLMLPSKSLMRFYWANGLVKGLNSRINHTISETQIS